MPLLQYYCENCKIEFEEFAKPNQPVQCPHCQAAARRSYSGKVQGSIGAGTKKCSGNCKNCSGC